MSITMICKCRQPRHCLRTETGPQRSCTDHPDAGSYGHTAVGVVHPAVPGEKALQRVPHDEDDGHPQTRANQYAPDHMLAVV